MKVSFDVKIVFDNKCVKEGFLPGFGFSALVYNHLIDSYLLFDTGGNSQTLFHNIKQFDISLTEINKIIISHNHHDHNGALTDIYNQNKNMSIYIPDGMVNYKIHFPLANIHLTNEFAEIEKCIYVLGQFGTSINEQALLLQTKDNDWIMIVGCTHPGLELFIIEARKTYPIKAIIGGFHDFRKFSFLEGINFIGACHCTAHLSDIKKKFPKQYRKVCVGDEFSF